MAACLTLGVTLAAWWIGAQAPYDTRFTPELFDRIELGMTEDEVRAVMDWPPGDYSHSQDPIAMVTWCGSESGEGHMEFWRDDRGMTCVGIDGGRATVKRYTPTKRSHIKAWLPWLRALDKIYRLIGF
jgi:hypothetical protein